MSSVSRATARRPGAGVRRRARDRERRRGTTGMARRTRC